MNQIVYVITSGSYSDYGINAVFLDRSEAERWVEQRQIPQPYRGYSDSYKIEEHPVGPCPETVGFKYVMALSREPLDDGHLYLYYIPDVDPPVSSFRIWDRGTRLRDVSMTVEWHLYVNAKDPEHALKIAGERRAQMLTGQAPYPIFTDRDWQTSQGMGVYDVARKAIVKVE